MKKIGLILLTLCLLSFSSADADSTAAVYEQTIRIHDTLPP